MEQIKKNAIQNNEMAKQICFRHMELSWSFLLFQRFLSFIQHYFFWIQPWMEWLKACIFNYLINPWNNRWNNWILLNDMPTWECCLPRKWVIAVAKLDSWNASHIIWIYFTRETKSPHSILEKSKPLRRKKEKKKLGWWFQECSAQPKSEACRQLKYDMTGSDSLVSRLSYKISCKSPQKWPLYFMHWCYYCDLVHSKWPSPGCLTRTEGNFPVVVFYTIYFLWHIKFFNFGS